MYQTRELFAFLKVSETNRTDPLDFGVVAGDEKNQVSPKEINTYLRVMSNFSKFLIIFDGAGLLNASSAFAARTQIQ